MAQPKSELPLRTRIVVRKCSPGYHHADYRLIATIALAEISRQVGRRAAGKVPVAPRPPIYDRGFERLASYQAKSYPSTICPLIDHTFLRVAKRAARPKR
jgi:hypothetical protein